MARVQGVRSPHLTAFLLIALFAAGALAQVTAPQPQRPAVTYPPETETEKEHRFQRNHGILMAISWGLLIPLGSMASRYIPAFGASMFYIHLILQIAGISLTIAALTQIIVQLGFSSDIWSCPGNWGKFLDEDSTACEFWMLRAGYEYDHGRVGVTVLIIALLQPLSAVFKPKPGTTGARRAWELFHTFIGRCAIMLGIFNVFFGIYVYTIVEGGDNGNWRPWVGLVVASVASINITQAVIDKYLRQKTDLAKEAPEEAEPAKATA